MALSERQKKGIGFLVVAGLFALAGAALLIWPVTPLIVPILLDVAVMIAAGFGIAVTAKPEF